MSALKKLAFGSGLILNLIGFSLLLLFWNLTTHKSEIEGTDCPPHALCIGPGFNAGTIGVDYSPMIKLNSSEPIGIKTHIYNLEPNGLGCSYQQYDPITIKYEAKLWTSGLDLSPSSPQTTSNSVNGGLGGDSEAEWVWIAYPKEPGTYSLHAEVLAKTGDCTVSRLSKTFKIEVVNLFGLNAPQVQMVSILGFILGTSLTVPGFIALWIQYKDRKEAKAAKEAEEKKNKKKVKLIISSSGQEKEIEIDDQTKD